MSNDTPISKYLASIGDRRHSLYGGNTQQTPIEQVVRPTLARTFDFDDTYYARDDTSLLFAPSPNKNKSSDSLSPVSTERKRKRTSILFEDNSENYEKKIDDLERLLRQTQAELIDSRAIVTKLQHQKIDNEAKYQEKIIHYDHAEKEMKRELQATTDKLQELEKKITKMENKEKEMTEDFNKQKMTLNCTISALHERVSKLQSTNSELEQKLFQETLKSGDTVRKLNTELEGTERGAEKWIIESQTLKEQLEVVQRQLNKCQSESKDAQRKVIRYEELQSKYEEVMSDENNIKALQEKLKKYENQYVQEQLRTRKLLADLAKLKQENETLRSTVSSEMVLREQISSLEKQNAFISEELKAKVASDTERSALRHELKEWKGIVSKLGSNCSTPLQFESFLRQNQNLLLEYKHENSNLKLELQNKENALLKLQADSKKDYDILREQVRTLKEEKDKLALELRKTTKRISLIAKDRDSLKGLKDSYELEFAGQKESMTNVRELQNRNLKLEEIVGEYEALVSDDPSFAKKPCDKCEELTTRLTSLTSELDQTKRDLEEKTHTLAVSETTFHQRNPDDTTTGDVSFKVLSYGKNPSILSTEERLKELLAENEQLRAKINKLESDSTLQNSNVSILEEKRSLEEQLKNLERKHEILTDAYDYETTQLQTAIGKLFGFHIILVREPQSQIRLQSVNSPDSQDLFIFQQSDNGDWMLLETPVLDIFRQEIEDYLVQAGQIPSFLAVVTVRYAQGMPSENLDDTVIHQQNPEGNQQQQLQQIQHGDDDNQQEYEENEEQQQEYSGEDDDESGSGSGNDERDEEVAEEEEYEEDERSEEEADDDDDEEDDRDNGRHRHQPPQQQQQQHYDYDDGSDDDDIVMLD